MNWAGVARCRWRLARGRLVTRGKGASKSPLLGATLAIALAALVGFGLAGLFGQLAVEGASAAETAGALALVLTAALLGLLVFDLQEAVSILVVDSDLDLLRRAPVSARSLFVLKLLDVFPRTSMLLWVLALPAAIAYHAFYPLPGWAWVAVPLEIGALWAIPLGLGIAIAILMLRHAPAARAREVLGLLSTLVLLALWLANSFLLPRLAGSSDDPIASLRGAIAGASTAYRFSPGYWAARGMAAAAAGAVPEVVGWTALLAGAAALSIGAAASIAARHLEEVRSRISGGAGLGRPGRRAEERRLAAARDRRGRVGAGGSPRGIVRAVLLRDARLFVREWTLLGDVATAAILWTLLPLVGAPLYHASSQEVARAMLVALTVGLGYEIAGRALPFERNAWVWMRLAPVRVSRWVAAKLVGAAIVSLPLVLLAAASMTLAMNLSGGEIMKTLCLVLPALALSLSVGLWTGATFGHPGWTNPRAMLTPTGRVVATLLLVVQAGLWLLLSIVTGPRQPLPFALSLWGPAAGAAALALVPLRATARRLRRAE